MMVDSTNRYQDNVPKDAKKIVSEYNSKWDSVMASVLQISTNAAPLPVCTGAAVAAAGAAMGVMAVL